jgi:hypothetical protein
MHQAILMSIAQLGDQQPTKREILEKGFAAMQYGC